MEQVIKMDLESTNSRPVQESSYSFAGVPGTGPEWIPECGPFRVTYGANRGTEILRNGISNEDLDVIALGSDRRLIIFNMAVSTSSQLMDMEKSRPFGEHMRAEGLKISVWGDTEILDPNASEPLSYHGQNDILSLEGIQFILNQFETNGTACIFPSRSRFISEIAADICQADDDSQNPMGDGGGTPPIRGKEADFMEGSHGWDLRNVWGGNESIRGGLAADFLCGHQGNDSVFGGRGDDYLSGSSGLDFLMGGAGADSISGGSGNDIMKGGEGRDTIVGGGGSDTFVFSLRGLSQRNGDCIVDFEVGVDQISLPHAVLFGLSRNEFFHVGFESNRSGLSTELDNRVVYEMDSGVLWLDLDGSETEYERFKIATLDEFLNLVGSDLIFH